jgi:hypothetical protein
VRNKVVVALLALLVVGMGLSACGGTQNVAGVTTPTAPSTPSGKQPPTDPRKSCDSQGINKTQLRTGACTQGGVQYVVGNYGAAVRLKTLGVAIRAASVAPQLSRNGKAVTPRFDAFVRFTLQVQNRDKVPHRFAFGQTMLGVGGDNYLERTDIERRVVGESLGLTNGGMIGPGESLSGDVIFDITEADYQVLNRKGRFFIWDFGGRAAMTVPRTSVQIGQIRLYAAERG